MPRAKSPERARSFLQAIHGYQQHHAPSTHDVQAIQSLAERLGVSPSMVYKFRQGHPIPHKHLPVLAQWALREAKMDCHWLRAFLRQCDYDNPALLAELCPPEPAPPIPDLRAEWMRPRGGQAHSQQAVSPTVGTRG